MSDPLPPWKGGPAHASGEIVEVPDLPAPTPSVPATDLPPWVFGHALGDGQPLPPDRPEHPDLSPVAFAVEPGWFAMSALVLDGRMVEFDSEAGTYQAPATASALTFEPQTTVIAKQWGVLPDGTLGYEPDVRYVPQQWREIP